MKKVGEPGDFFGWCGRMLERLKVHLKAPAMFVGNRDRVRKPGEEDGDAVKLREINKTWREMLRDDPWMVKLRPHLQRLSMAMGILLILQILGGIYLPRKHSFSDWMTVLVLTTIPYWLWVGKWYKRIQDKVWDMFTKKFGKYFHRW